MPAKIWKKENKKVDSCNQVVVMLTFDIKDNCKFFCKKKTSGLHFFFYNGSQNLQINKQKVDSCDQDQMWDFDVCQILLQRTLKFTQNSILFPDHFYISDA